MLKTVIRPVAALVCAAVIAPPATLLANSGDPIPVPSLSVVAASDAATAAFRAGNPFVAAPVEEDLGGFFLQSAVYGQDDTGAWAWRIRFTHPQRNDKSLTYVVSPDGAARMTDLTE